MPQPPGNRPNTQTPSRSISLGVSWRFFLGGMCSSSSRGRCSRTQSSLSSGNSASRAGPVSPPRMTASRVCTAKPPLRLRSPWQRPQRSTKMGCTSAKRSSSVSEAAGVCGSPSPVLGSSAGTSSGPGLAFSGSGSAVHGSKRNSGPWVKLAPKWAVGMSSKTTPASKRLNAAGFLECTHSKPHERAMTPIPIHSCSSIGSG